MGNKNPQFPNTHLLKLITTFVCMPIYISIVQKMISIKLGFKENMEIMSWDKFLQN